MFINDLITYTGCVDNELSVQTDLMFEICSELGLFPSKYQRANMQVNYIIRNFSILYMCNYKMK